MKHIKTLSTQNIKKCVDCEEKYCTCFVENDKMALIGVETDDATGCFFIYCDKSNKETLNILKEHYNDINKVMNLVRFGGILRLENTVEECFHYFDVELSYNSYPHYRDLHDFWELCKDDEVNAYLFAKGKWHLKDNNSMSMIENY